MNHLVAVLPWPLSNLSLRSLRKNLRDFPPSSRSTMGQMLPEGSATLSIGMSWAVIFCMAAITEIWWLTVGKIWQQFERAMNSRCLRCVLRSFTGSESSRTNGDCLLAVWVVTFPFGMGADCGFKLRQDILSNQLQLDDHHNHHN